jgi:hypothetical protein
MGCCDSYLSQPDKASDTIVCFIIGVYVPWLVQEAIKDSYVDLVVADLNPISVVDGIAFKKLMKDAEPLFKGYTRQALTKRIIKKYQDEFAKVKANVQSDQENGSGPVSITTDIWSSKRAEDAVDVCTGSSTPSLTHSKHVHLVTSAPGTCL